MVLFLVEKIEEVLSLLLWLPANQYIVRKVPESTLDYRQDSQAPFIL